MKRPNNSEVILPSKILRIALQDSGCSGNFNRADESPALRIDQAVQHSDFLALNGVSQVPELYGVGHLERHHSSRDVDMTHRCSVHPERERDGQESQGGAADSAQLPQQASACGLALSESVEW
jgi:hypothetical protein